MFCMCLTQSVRTNPTSTKLINCQGLSKFLLAAVDTVDSGVTKVTKLYSGLYTGTLVLMDQIKLGTNVAAKSLNTETLKQSENCIHGKTINDD